MESVGEAEEVAFCCYGTSNWRAPVYEGAFFCFYKVERGIAKGKRLVYTSHLKP